MLDDRRLGLVISHKKLAYGWGHGTGQRIPDCLKRSIVKVWNFISCRIFGHDWIPCFTPAGDDDMHRRVCYSCCKEEPFEWESVRQS